MSEQEADQVECAICGREGYPLEGCEKCEGRAEVQLRHYTLSELRGMTQEERDAITLGDRPSGAAPKIVRMPGSA